MDNHSTLWEAADDQIVKDFATSDLVEPLMAIPLLY